MILLIFQHTIHSGCPMGSWMLLKIQILKLILLLSEMDPVSCQFFITKNSFLGEDESRYCLWNFLLMKFSVRNMLLTGVSHHGWTHTHKKNIHSTLVTRTNYCSFIEMNCTNCLGGRLCTSCTDSLFASCHNSQVKVFTVIQKFLDWVNNEINNNNKHSLRSNTKGYGSKTH
jgi:hypothetical protein